MERPDSKAKRTAWMAYAEHLEEELGALDTTNAEFMSALEKQGHQLDQYKRDLHRIKNAVGGVA